MIKINLGGDQGIVDIPNWEELTSRPRFKTRIDPVKTKIKDVIGWYSFDFEIHCGLPCNQPHKSGYLVLTEDGYETNVGHICGQELAGAAEFKVMKNRLEAAHKRQEAAESLRVFRSQQTKHQMRFDSLWEIAKAVTPCKTALLNAGEHVPKAISTQINNSLRTGKATLTRTLKLSKQEVEQAEVVSGKKSTGPQYKEVEIGRLSGLDFFASKHDLRTLLTLGIKFTLEAASEIDIETATDAKLIDLAKRIGDLDQQFKATESAINEAQKFLSGANLKNLEKIDGLTPSDLKSWRRFVKNLPDISSKQAA